VRMSENCENKRMGNNEKMGERETMVDDEKEKGRESPSPSLSPPQQPYSLSPSPSPLPFHCSQAFSLDVKNVSLHKPWRDVRDIDWLVRGN
jgi:hypothetical protein